MASLQKIKNKINSIEVTQKITNAMKQVAIVNLRKERNKHDNISIYLQEFYSFFVKLLAHIKNLQNEVENPKRLYLIFSSCIGLCGNFNSNIINKAISEIKENDDIIIIGRKGYSLLKAKNLEYQVKMFINVNPKNLNEGLSDEIVNKIYDYFINNKYTHLLFIYTKFINSLNLHPIVKDILPINFKTINQEDLPKNDFIFEPSAELILQNVEKLFFKVCFEGAITESNVSENALRRNSMDTASRNADKLKDEYKIEYNRTRQAKITQEINEIVGGFNKDE